MTKPVPFADAFAEESPKKVPFADAFSTPAREVPFADAFAQPLSEKRKEFLTKQEPEVGALEAGARGFAQGVVFDFADELEALAKSAFGDKTYKEAVAASRARFKAAEDKQTGAYWAGTILGALVPTGAGVASGLRGAAKAGTKYGAISGVGRAESLAEAPKEAALGAAFGAAGGVVLHPVAKLLSRAATKKDVAAAKAVTKELTSDQADLLSKALKDAEQAPEFPGIGHLRQQAELLAQDPTNNEANSAKRFLDLVDKITGTKGEGLDEATLADLYNTQHRLDEAIRFNVRDEMKTASPEGTVEIEHLFNNKVISTMADVHRLAQRVDTKTKTTDLASAIEDIHRGINQTSVQVSEILTDPKIKAGIRSVPKLNTIQEKLEFIKEAELGNRREFTDIFVGLRETANTKFGYAIPEVKKTDAVKVYLPQKMGDKNTVYRQLLEAINLKDDELLNTEVKGAINTLFELDDKGGRFDTLENVTAEEARKRLETWFRRTGSDWQTKLARRNAAMLERGAFVPRLLRDLNPQSLVQRYVGDMVRAANLRKPTYHLLAQAQALEDAGYMGPARYIKDYAAGIAGDAGVLPKAFSGLTETWKHAVAGWDTKHATTKELLYSVPDFFGWLSSQIYPNVMGLPNVAAPIRNATQTITTTMPELGWRYGSRVVNQGWKAGRKAAFKISEAKKYLEDLALLPKVQHLEGMVPEHGIGLKGVPVVGPATQKVEALNELMMSLHSYTETLNRYVAAKSGEAWADDLLKGLPAAREALRKSPGGVQSRARFLLEKGDEKGLKELMARHLVTTTQFIYGKEGQSKAVRELGRLFTMFSKWPTNVITDITFLARDKELRRVAERYLYPLAVAFGGTLAFKEAEVLDTPEGRTLFGKSLMGYAPLSSLPSVPPLVATINAGMDGFKEVLKGEPGNAAATLHKAAYPFMPVYGAYESLRRRYKDTDWELPSLLEEQKRGRRGQD